jgi:hypothetical protein
MSRVGRGVVLQSGRRVDGDAEFERDSGDGGGNRRFEAFGRQPPAQAAKPVGHEGLGGGAVVTCRHWAEHGMAKRLDLGPFGPPLLSQEMEGDRFHQHQALDARAQRARRLECQSGAVGMAHQMKRAFDFLGEGEQHADIGVDGEGLFGRPRRGLPISR